MKIDDKDRNLEDIDESELTEDQQYAYDLITKARSEKHSEFELITNLEEFHDLRFRIAEARTSTKQFSKAGKALCNVYAKKLKDGYDDVFMLISARNCFDIADYWRDELEILKDIKDEFKTYMFMGHFIDTITGKERSEDDMFDYREMVEAFTDESEDKR